MTGLARSDRAAGRLAAAGLPSRPGDFRDPPSLVRAVAALDPEAVVVIASAGGGLGDAAAFSADRDAVQALAAAMQGRGKTLVFTSGSAVFGVFAGGRARRAGVSRGYARCRCRARCSRRLRPASPIASLRATPSRSARGSKRSARCSRRRACAAIVIRPGQRLGLRRQRRHPQIHRAGAGPRRRAALGTGRDDAGLRASRRRRRSLPARRSGAGGRAGSITRSRRRRASGRWGWRSAACSASAREPTASRSRRWPRSAACGACASASTSASTADRTRAELGWTPKRLGRPRGRRIRLRTRRRHADSRACGAAKSDGRRRNRPGDRDLPALIRPPALAARRTRPKGASSRRKARSACLDGESYPSRNRTSCSDFSWAGDRPGKSVQRLEKAQNGLGPPGPPKRPAPPAGPRSRRPGPPAPARGG